MTERNEQQEWTLADLARVAPDIKVRVVFEPSVGPNGTWTIEDFMGTRPGTIERGQEEALDSMFEHAADNPSEDD